MHAIALTLGIILAAIFAFAVMRWWSEGIIEASDALLLIVVFGGLIFGMFVATGFGQFMCAFVPLAIAGSYAIYSYKVGGLKAFYKKTLRRIYAGNSI